MTNKLSIIFSFLGLFSLVSYGQGVPDKEFNTLLRTENGGWVAGDATFSIYLPDGRTLWLFGDSFIGTANPDSSLAPGAKMIRNCAVIQDDENMEAIYNGTFENPENLVSTLTPDSTWFWPEHGLVENDTLKIIFSEFGTNDAPSGWNFEYRNAWMVYFTYPQMEYINQTLLPYYNTNGVMYGDRILNHEGYNYIYGRKSESGNKMAHIARVSEGNILGTWEFFDGEGWSEEDTTTTRISIFPISEQFGVFEHSSKFVMITQAIMLGSKIYSIVSDAPEGPFFHRKELYSTPYPFSNMFTYNSYPHPQFNENNELLISYNSNGDFLEIFNNVELYRPQFIRVDFSIIDTSFVSLALPEKEIETICTCFPNPAKDYIIFNISTKTKSPINIYSLDGKLALSISDLDHQNQNIRVNTSNLLPGLYIYRYENMLGKFIHN